MWQGFLSKVFKIREKVALNLNQGDEEKPFLDHLDDLRKMLVRIAITLFSSVIITFVFNQQLLDIIMIPYKWGMDMAVEARAESNKPAEEVKKQAEAPAPEQQKATTTSGQTVVNIYFWVPGSPVPIVDVKRNDQAPVAPPDAKPDGEVGTLTARLDALAKAYDMPGTRTPQEGFMVCVNVSLIAAVIVSFPLLLLFILQFVLPGLRDNEKGILFPALGIGFGLFLTGVAFAYFAVLPRTLGFFASWNFEHGIKNTWMLGDYVTFATRFILIFGISFELPVVVMALVKLDFLSYTIMKGTRSYAAIAIAVASALITPTSDILTLSLLAVPLYILYEICIWMAFFLEKKERKMYPEFYAERDKDEAELAKEPATPEWDNDEYNPFSTADDDDDDPDVDAYRRKESAPSTATANEDTTGKPSSAETETGEPAAEIERRAADADAPTESPRTETEEEARARGENRD